MKEEKKKHIVKAKLHFPFVIVDFPNPSVGHTKPITNLLNIYYAFGAEAVAKMCAV